MPRRYYGYTWCNRALHLDTMASELFLGAWKRCYDAVAKEPTLRSKDEVELLALWLAEKGEILKRLPKGLQDRTYSNI